MNKSLPLIALCLLSVALGALCIQQHLKITALGAKAEAQSKATELAATLASQETSRLNKKLDDLAQKMSWLAKESAALREKNQKLQAELAKSPTAQAPAAATPQPEKKAGGMKAALAAMMNDPEMKAMMRKQQAQVLEGKLGEYTKALGLTPEQGRQLIDLLIQQQNEQMDGIADPLNPTKEETSKMADLSKAHEAALKSLLGDEKYAKYQDYQKGTLSRMQMDQLKQQLSSTQTPLQDGQAQTVGKIIQEETSRSNPWSNLKPEDFSDPDKLESQFNKMEEQNQKILARARPFLSVPQYEAFQKSLANSLEAQKMGLKMAAKMRQP